MEYKKIDEFLRELDLKIENTDSYQKKLHYIKTAKQVLQNELNYYLELVMKKYTWINDEVKLDFPLPKILQNKIKLIEKLDAEQNELYFDECGYLDDDAKNLYAEGAITKKQWELIVTRYDWSVENQC